MPVVIFLSSKVLQQNLMLLGCSVWCYEAILA